LSLHASQKQRRSPSQDGAGAYSALVGIDITHEYCNAPGERFDGIAVSPTPQTAARLGRWGLVARPRPDGIDVFCRADAIATLSEFLASLPPVLPPGVEDELFGGPLLFKMELRDLDFFNFTAAPTDCRSGDPILLLSDDAVEIGNGFASFKVDWNDPPERPPGLDRSKLPSPRHLLSEALGRRLDGWWFESRGQINDAFDERDTLRKGAQPGPFGLIQIYAAAPAMQGGPTTGWNGYPVNLRPGAGQSYVTASSYRLRFEARQTRWRYVVAARDGAPAPDTLSIVDPDDPGAARFEPPQPRLLPNGQSAECFAAKEPIALSRHPQLPFSLRGTLNGRRPRTLIDRLPAPSAAAIVPDPTPQPDGSASPAWSDIYVFV
jgi:hypothetical protein